MEIEVRDAPDHRRYEVRFDAALAGLVTYRLRPGLVAFLHTEVDERYQGRGLGSALIAGALGDVWARGLAVLPFCPFVNAYLERHPEDVDLVPEGRRAAFGLGYGQAAEGPDARKR